MLLSVTDILNNLGASDIPTAVADIVAFDQVKEALQLLRALEQEAVGNPSMAEYISILRWIALPMVPATEAMEAFRRDFGAAVQLLAEDNFDLAEKLRTALVHVPFVEDRDEFKHAVRDILTKSDVRLTDASMTRGQLPTLANWIKDYVSAVGNEPADVPKQGQYFSTNENMRRLGATERERVKKFFIFFERLKTSSQTIEGFEETVSFNQNGRTGFIKNGTVYYTKPSEQARSSKMASIAGRVIARVYGDATVSKKDVLEGGRMAQLQFLAAQYPSGSLERRAVEEEMAKLEQPTAAPDA